METMDSLLLVNAYLTSNTGNQSLFTLLGASVRSLHGHFEKRKLGSSASVVVLLTLLVSRWKLRTEYQRLQ